MEYVSHSSSGPTGSATPEPKAARRDGVTVDQVNGAIEKLVREGVAVTLRSVRAEIGSGSLTTIQKHLSARRQAPSDFAPESALSPQVLRVLDAELGRVVRDRTAHLEDEARSTRASLEQVLEENETLRQAHNAAENVIEAQRASLHEQYGKEGALKGQLQELGEFLAIARSEAETARQALALSQQQLQAKEERCAFLTADIQAVRQDLLDTRSELEKTTRDVEAARRTVSALERQVAAMQTVNVALEASVEKNNRLQNELQEVHSRAAVLEVTKNSLEERLTEAKQLLVRTEENAQHLLDKVLTASPTEHK